MNIFTLTGSILVDNAKANESIQKTDSLAESLHSKLGNGIATAGKWGAAILAGAAAAGAALGGVVMAAVETTGALDDTSKKVGMTAEEFQKYAYAAKLSGMESATLEKAMIKQQKAFSDAKTGSKSMSEAYEKLGVDISKIGTSGEAFDVVIKKLSEMDDETQRNALASDIFGKSYAELAPLLGEGADGIEKLKQEAVDMGAVMSNDAVSAGAQFGDMLDSAKMSLETATAEIGVEFMPILQEMLQWVLDHMPEIKEFMHEAFRVIANVVQEAKDIFEKMQPILQALYDFVLWAFPLVSDAIKLACDIIVGVAGAVYDVFNDISNAIQSAINKLNEWNGTPAENKYAQVVYEDGRSSAGGTLGPSARGVNGTQAAGLAFVPFDGFKAMLHAGERILTKEENKNFSGSGSKGSIYIDKMIVQDKGDEANNIAQLEFLAAW